MNNTYKILVGDNSADYGILCANMLREKGFQVIVKPKDGMAIYEAIKTEAPDVVILDAFMPQMDGIKLVKSFQETATRPLFYSDDRL